MLLKDKTAVVTGGSKGIGKAIVELFLKEGASVYYISRSEGDTAGFEALANEAGTEVKWKQGSVSDSSKMNEIATEIIKEKGQVDILVNNAGITRDGLSFMMKDEAWNDVIETNLSSVFYLSRPISRSMAKKRSGSIINVSSVVGIIGNAGQCNYAAAKAGIIGYTKSLARETAGRGVRVNAIAPGFIQSDMTDAIPDAAKEELKTKIPFGRIGTPEEVANTVLFLASEMSSYITGQVISIDGGMGM
ncbi:MAG: 3-oxoacyl-[acyl-carrier-protein] reductase [Spirochaetales bacterium]|uniref:3-oxoacyl-[acyl-carrier-protein] reductase n=1 Tax=Candidatus Thalassospirochaeta sargassi TaxID=3119039 RepID=A0AAJ1MN60_9SPIO|nr:3-oxoacyl-[acyl-carrier-protein] reductase [Spirochaetales bacterium]